MPFATASSTMAPRAGSCRCPASPSMTTTLPAPVAGQQRRAALEQCPLGTRPTMSPTVRSGRLDGPIRLDRPHRVPSACSRRGGSKRAALRGRIATRPRSQTISPSRGLHQRAPRALTTLPIIAKSQRSRLPRSPVNTSPVARPNERGHPARRQAGAAARAPREPRAARRRHAHGARGPSRSRRPCPCRRPTRCPMLPP